MSQRTIAAEATLRGVGLHLGRECTLRFLPAASGSGIRFRRTDVAGQPEQVLARVRHDRKRPLLQVDDPMERLKALHAARDPLYRQTAHLTVDTGRPSLQALVHLIVMQLELAGVHTAP